MQLDKSEQVYTKMREEHHTLANILIFAKSCKIGENNLSYPSTSGITSGGAVTSSPDSSMASALVK